MSDLAAIDPNMLIETAADPAEYVVACLERCKSWLTAALEQGDLERLVEMKGWAATLRTATMQKNLGKDAELAATELVRRAERAIGLGIRAGQSAGEIKRTGDKDVHFNPKTGDRVHVDNTNSKASPTDFATQSELSANEAGIYAITDDVTDEQFEQAIEEAKSESNLSRANVTRKVKGTKKPAPNIADMDTRNAVKTLAGLGLTAQQIADDLGIAKGTAFNLARDAGIALPGSQLAKERRTPIIEEMAAAGHDSSQIGQKLGLSASHVRIEAKRLGIEIPADAIVGKTRHLDSNRIVRASVESVDGIGILFDQIDYAQLDPEDVKGWLPILETSIRSLTTLRNNLRKASQP